MKSAFLKLLTVAFFVAVTSCNNEKKEEPVKERTTIAPAPAPAKEKERTEISVGPDGGSVKTKDVNVKLNTKDTTKH